MKIPKRAFELEPVDHIFIGSVSGSVIGLAKYVKGFSGKKIFLDLHVSVKKGWSKTREGLEEFRYVI